MGSESSVSSHSSAGGRAPVNKGIVFARSKPAQNVEPGAPVNTTARISASSRITCHDRASRMTNSGLRAFRASGRFSVTTAMELLTFTPKTDIGTYPLLKKCPSFPAATTGDAFLSFWPQIPEQPVDVCSWPLTDISIRTADVRFWGNSGHRAHLRRCPLALSGHNGSCV